MSSVTFAGPGWTGEGKGPEGPALGDPRNPLMSFSSMPTPGLGAADPNKIQTWLLSDYTMVNHRLVCSLPQKIEDRM